MYRYGYFDTRGKSVLKSRPNMNQSHGYSLWLIPKSAAYYELELTIRNLAESYQSPIFPPHLTLISGMECSDLAQLTEKTQLLSRSQRPFCCPIERIEFSNQFFQCVYLKIFPTEDLRGLRTQSLSYFETRDSLFYPHLSLIYGNLTEQTKTAICRKFEKKFPSEIEFASLALFHTDGPPENWRMVDQLPFLT